MQCEIRFSHPPPVLFLVKESVLHDMFKSEFSPDGPTAIFSKIWAFNARKQFSYPITCFLWVRRVCQSTCFLKSFSGDGPAPYFWKRDHQWEHKFQIDCFRRCGDTLKQMSMTRNLFHDTRENSMTCKLCWPLTFHFAPADVTLDIANFERCWHAGGRETEWHQPCWPKWTFTKAFLRMRVSHFTFRIFEAWANEKDGSWAQSVGRRRQELNLECHPRSFETLSVVPQHDHS